MPNYDFKCTNCNHRFTKMVSMENRKNVKCPKCNGETEQIIAWRGGFTTGSSGGACNPSRGFT